MRAESSEDQRTDDRSEEVSVHLGGRPRDAAGQPGVSVSWGPVTREMWLQPCGWKGRG